VLERQRSTAPSKHVVYWPTHGDTSINEFSTDGYVHVSGAFPTLFPTGASPDASKQVLMMLVDCILFFVLLKVQE